MFQIKSKMAWLSLFLMALSASVSSVANAEGMKPFYLGSTSSGGIAAKVAAVKTSLATSGLEIVGEYAPYETSHIIVVTNDTLKKAAASHARAGYLAAQRIAITKVGDDVQVSYTNPDYMAAAYRVKTNVSAVTAALKAALGSKMEYGVDEAKSADDLNNYHYMFGMEYFDDPYELASHGDYDKAVAAVEKGLAAGAGGVKKVYRIDVPGTKQTLFGVAMKASANGNQAMDDNFIMSEIDFKDVRSSAHLPYEMLVNNGDVEALNARFRIAMNFPDLSMMGANSFMNIMAAPDAIGAALTKASGGKIKDDF